MKVLVGVVNMTPGKGYCFPKFFEMANACILPSGADIIYVGDQMGRTGWLDTHVRVEYLDAPASPYQDDMTRLGRQLILDTALEEGYDKVVWQGVDAYYCNKEDFERLISHNYRAVGGLVAGRNRPDYPVCRRFVKVANGDVTFQQEEMIDDLRMLIESLPSSKAVIRNDGFPGADALVIDKSLFRYSLDDPDYSPWYGTDDFMGMCCEEYWCWKLVNDGIPIWCDTSVRLWHAHETRRTARFPDEECDLASLSWNATIGSDG